MQCCHWSGTDCVMSDARAAILFLALSLNILCHTYPLSHSRKPDSRAVAWNYLASHCCVIHMYTGNASPVPPTSRPRFEKMCAHTYREREREREREMKRTTYIRRVRSDNTVEYELHLGFLYGGSSW